MSSFFNIMDPKPEMPESLKDNSWSFQEVSGLSVMLQSAGPCLTVPDGLPVTPSGSDHQEPA